MNKKLNKTTANPFYTSNDVNSTINWMEWTLCKIKKGKLSYLKRIKAVCEVFLKDEFLKQADIVRKLGIPKSTVSRIVKELEKIGALSRISLPIARLDKTRSSRHVLNPKFVDFLNEHLSKISTSTQFDLNSPHISKYNAKNLKFLCRPNSWLNKVTQEERDNWARNGLFRVHGFQRCWILKNYTLIDDEYLWNELAMTLNPPTVKNPVKKVLYGRGKKAPSYIILAPSEFFNGVCYQLHFKKKKLIVSLPRESSIWISWDEFREDLEQIIGQDIRAVVEKAIKAYNMWFKQQVLAYDDGWVGKKKPLKPEVGYIDPDGIIRKVYEVEGATYIEDLGFWIDASLKPTPEMEFRDVESASKFKRAIDALASRELYERIDLMYKRLENVEKGLANKTDADRAIFEVLKDITLQIQKLVELVSFATLTAFSAKNEINPSTKTFTYLS